MKNKLCREDLAWAAGIFDGEGCFSIRKHTCTQKRDRGLVAKLKMTDEDIIRRFHKIIQVGNVTGPYCASDRKPVWIWQVGSFEGVQATIAFLWTWLGLRRKAKVVELLVGHHAWRLA